MGSWKLDGPERSRVSMYKQAHDRLWLGELELAFDLIAETRSAPNEWLVIESDAAAGGHTFVPHMGKKSHPKYLHEEDLYRFKLIGAIAHGPNVPEKDEDAQKRLAKMAGELDLKEWKKSVLEYAANQRGAQGSGRGTEHAKKVHVHHSHPNIIVPVC